MTLCTSHVARSAPLPLSQRGRTHSSRALSPHKHRCGTLHSPLALSPPLSLFTLFPLAQEGVAIIFSRSAHTPLSACFLICSAPRRMLLTGVTLCTLINALLAYAMVVFSAYSPLLARRALVAHCRSAARHKIFCAHARIALTPSFYL